MLLLWLFYSDMIWYIFVHNTPALFSFNHLTMHHDIYVRLIIHLQDPPSGQPVYYTLCKAKHCPL